MDAAAPGANKVAKKAMDAALKPMVKQTLEIASFAREDYDFGKMAVDTTIRFGTSFLKAPGDYTPYPGIDKMIGNLPCNVARGGAKYVREYLIPMFGQ